MNQKNTDKIIISGFLAYGITNFFLFDKIPWPELIPKLARHFIFMLITSFIGGYVCYKFYKRRGKSE